MEFVEQFKPLAEERLLEKILIDESKEGLLVLEDFQETIRRAEEVNEATIYEEAKNLAKNDASGVVGTIKTLPRALGTINWIEVLLVLGTILIIYGFKKITTAIPNTCGSGCCICSSNRFWNRLFVYSRNPKRISSH